MFSVFNAICTPVFMYYFVTILCMAPWLQGRELKSTTALPEEETFFGTLGKPFWGVSVNVLAAVSSKSNKPYKLEAGNTWLKIIFLVFLYSGLIYQFLLFFFTFYDLLHTQYTYTSTVYYACVLPHWWFSAFSGLYTPYTLLPPYGLQDRKAQLSKKSSLEPQIASYTVNCSALLPHLQLLCSWKLLHMRKSLDASTLPTTMNCHKPTLPILPIFCICIQWHLHHHSRACLCRHYVL